MKLTPKQSELLENTRKRGFCVSRIIAPGYKESTDTIVPGYMGSWSKRTLDSLVKAKFLMLEPEQKKRAYRGETGADHLVGYRFVPATSKVTKGAKEYKIRDRAVRGRIPGQGYRVWNEVQVVLGRKIVGRYDTTLEAQKAVEKLVRGA